MIILGFSHLQPSPTGHDSTVAILEDGILRAAISEERFSRIKHDGGFPSSAVKFCLNTVGITLDEVDKIVVGFGLQDEDIDHSTEQRFSSYVKTDSRFKKIGIDNKNPKFFNHQYTHVRTAYSMTNFNKAVAISLDGGGVDDGKTNAGGIFIIENGNIEPVIIYPSSASLGFVYGSFTDLCGFRMQDGEGKTMSLAAYGENEPLEDKQKAYSKISKIFPTFRDINYVEGGVKGLIGKFQNNVQLLANIDQDMLALRQEFKQELIAWAAQRKLEETVTELVMKATEITGLKNVILTGGVFMNMILNMKIRESFDKNYQIFFNPICGDLGNALGAVFEQHHVETGKSISIPDMPLYLGPSYDDEEIIVALRRLNLDFKKIDGVQTAIDLVNSGHTVGWFQGRSELGARALGNRSIISLATDNKFKDIVNNKVKKRESWRPFCPTIIDQRSSHFLKNTTNAPYMILGVRMNDPQESPAVCHIDGTCRPQILQREINPKFYDVVKGAGDIVLNTSFNLAGDPLVETPTDALMTFKKSGLDDVIINDFLISKTN